MKSRSPSPLLSMVILFSLVGIDVLKEDTCADPPRRAMKTLAAQFPAPCMGPCEAILVKRIDCRGRKKQKKEEWAALVVWCNESDRILTLTEEERPTPYQVPPTDIIVEEAIEPKPKDSGAKEDEDAFVVESATNISEAVVEEPIKHKAAAIVDESNDTGPIGSEAILDQPDARANGPTGPTANEELPKEDIATNDDTIVGPTGDENTHRDYSPPGMNGPKETISASLSSDNDDNDDGIDANIDSTPPSNHVSVDLEASPIVDL